MTSLREQGYRYVKRNGRFIWTHPALVEPSDTDCTDMGDDEFEAFVRLTENGLPGIKPC